MENFIMFFAPLFVIGSVWSIMFVGFFFGMLIALTENENDFWALFFVGLFVMAFMHFNPTFELPSIGTALKYFITYFVVGALWSIGKWFFFVKEFATSFGEEKCRFFEYVNKRNPENAITVNKKTPIPEHLHEEFRKWYSDKGLNPKVYTRPGSSWEDYIAQIIPTATSYKSKLVRWITWWPLSATWTIINDPIRKLANQIFSRLQGIYTRISNHAFKGLIQ